MRNRGLVKAMAKWAGLWEETRRAKLYVLDVYEQMCRAQNTPALGMTVVRRLLFGPGYYTVAAVDFSGINWGPAGARAFGGVMRGLDLRGEALESPSLPRIREYCSCSGFEAVRCASCRLSCEGARELVGTVVACGLALTALDISANDLGPHGAESLVRLLTCRACPLRRLVADGNALGDAGIAAIACAALASETLAHLSLKKNHAAVAAGSALGRMLKGNTALVELDLSGNDIHGAGASELADGLVTNKSLTSLNLSRNSFGGSKVMPALSRAIRHCSLVTLDISDNHIGDESVLLFVEGLKVNQPLRTVIFDGNPIQMKGARELLKHVGFQADGTFSRTISLRNCSCQIVVPCLLNPREPVGFYSLHMQEDYALPVMQYLLSMQQTGDFEFDSGVGTHILMPDPMKNKIKQLKCKVSLNFAGDPSNWKLPRNGLLEFLYVDKRVHAVEKAAAAKAVVEILRQYSRGNEIEVEKQDALNENNQFGNSQSGYYAFERLVENLSIIPVSDTEKRFKFLASSVLQLLSEKDHRVYPLLIQEEHNKIQALLSAKSEESLFSFSNGHYNIDLSVPALRNIALRLQNLKNSMAREEGDLVESLRKKGMPSAHLEAMEIVWRHLKLDEQQIKYSELWLIPHNGMLQFNFVDIRKPAADQKSMSNSEFKSLILDKWQSTSKLLKLSLMQPNGKLTLLQEITVSKYFSCAQVAEMLDHFSPLDHSDIRTEIYVLCWSRTVDWHGLRNVLGILTPFERKVVQYRIGALTQYDEMMVVGHYELDLGLVDEWFLFREIFKLTKVEPGSCILHPTLNGSDWNLPSVWHDNEIPSSGSVTFNFVRTSEVLDIVFQQGAFSHSRHRPCPASLSTFCEQWMKPFCGKDVASPSGSAWIKECVLRNVALKLTQRFESAEKVLSMLDVDNDHRNFSLSRLKQIIGTNGVWLYPFEIQELDTLLDPHNTGNVEIYAFTLFWKKYALNKFVGPPLFENTE